MTDLRDRITRPVDRVRCGSCGTDLRVVVEIKAYAQLHVSPCPCGPLAAARAVKAEYLSERKDIGDRADAQSVACAAVEARIMLALRDRDA